MLSQKPRVEVLDTVGACPYCGDEVSLEPTDLCCGEVHGEEHFLIAIDGVEQTELFSEDELAAIKDKYK